MEFNSFGPAVGRLGSDSSRGAKLRQSRSRGAEPPSPLTLTTGVDGVVLETLTPSALSAAPMVHNPGAHGAPKLLAHSSRISATTDRRTRRHAMYTLFRKQLAAITQVIKR